MDGDYLPFYLNVWIDYGTSSDKGGVDGLPDGKYQSAEYEIIDAPLWGCDKLQDFTLHNPYPYRTGASGYYPDIGIQPYANYGLQLFSFTIPAMPSLDQDGKQTFARFRISRQPFDLSGANNYSLADPAHGYVKSGEVQDYPMFITPACSSGLFGASRISVKASSTITAVSDLHAMPLGGSQDGLPSPILIGIGSALDPSGSCEFYFPPLSGYWGPPLPSYSGSTNLGASAYPFSIRVSNTGQSNMTGVVVSYLIPTNCVVFAAVTSQGTWTQQVGAVTFTLGELDAGDQAQIGLNFLPKASGWLDHEFLVSADQPLLNSEGAEVHITNFVSIAGSLSIVPNQDGTLTLTWPNDGWTLLEATTVLGPWSVSAWQTSPRTYLPTGVSKFYRLSRPY